MASYFKRAATYVGLSSSEQQDSPEFLAKLEEFRSHVEEAQKVRDALQLYNDAAEAMLAA